MTQNQENLALPELYCRLCLSEIKKDLFKNIFALCNSFKFVVQIVEDFAKVEIGEDDAYSKLICMECYQKITALEGFKAVIKQSDLILKTRFANKEPSSANLIEKFEIEEVDLNKVKEDSEKLLQFSNRKPQNQSEFVAVKNEFENILSETIVLKKKYKPILLKCRYCDKTFKSYTGRLKHQTRHTGIYPYKCTICNKNCADKTAFTVHELSHSEKPGFHCDICGKAFKFPGSLRIHKESHNGALSCEICNKTFKNHHTFTRHKRVHSDKYPFVCERCNYGYETEDHLKRHFEHNHKPVATTPCYICGKIVRCLSVHIKTHTKPYKCEICKKAFGTKRILNIHKVKHTGEKLFACKICNKEYMYGAQLYVHMRTHDIEKQLSCDQCDKKFIYRYNLKKHVEKVHIIGNNK